MENWVQECSSSHEECARSIGGIEINETTAPIVADYILDVGVCEDGLVKLSSTVGLTGQYCTLSHCWGSPYKKPLCLLSQNKARFLEGISIVDLPATFRDAVAVTRALGIRYLWIDSLCILQDSYDHWMQESAIMGAIYENAYVRLSADSAEDSSEGLGSVLAMPSNDINTERLNGRSTSNPHYADSFVQIPFKNSATGSLHTINFRSGHSFYGYWSTQKSEETRLGTSRIAAHTAQHIIWQVPRLGRHSVVMQEI